MFLRKNANRIIFLIFFLSLTTAFVAEFVYQIKPCSLCLYLRYNYGAVIVVSFFILVLRKSRILDLIRIVFILSALGLSFFHVGVEQKWWRPLESCALSSPLDGLHHQNLTPQEQVTFIQQNIQNFRMAPCDQVNWRIFDISVTIWNTLLLIMTLFFAFFTLKKPQNGQ